MTEKEFDDILRGKLEQYQPEYDARSWDDLEQRIEQELEATDDASFDDAVRAALTGFAAAEMPGSWDDMEKLIEADEATSFDHEVKSKVANYTEPYNPETWPILDNKIEEEERLRRRLVVAKVLEVAAVLIMLLTVHNLMPDIREAISNDGDATQSAALADFDEAIAVEEFKISESTSQVTAQSDQLSSSDEQIESKSNLTEQTSEPFATNVELQETGTPVMDNSTGIQRAVTQLPLLPSRSTEVSSGAFATGVEACQVDPDINGRAKVASVDEIGSIAMAEQIDPGLSLAMPEPVLPRSRKSLRLSIGGAFDVNNLYMPSEQFYANGRKIKFSEKDLLAYGYSTGSGFIFDHGSWSFETGLYYSSKTFEPNRVLKIGNSLDVRTVDFDKISLHVVSVPLYGHWNFDKKGKTRMYLVGGAAFNLIVTAHYDLLTSGSQFGPPGSSRTDYEVQQVRANFLDDAEFSSKSYVNVTGGFGVEHYLDKKFSVFAQPTYNYQVPFFHISDHAGKHLQFLSMQVGTRIRLK